jgi:Tol biopolymer transport system component
MGEVYRARDTRLDREVAVKVLPEKFAEDSAALARFEREAKALAALSHPNLVGIFDFAREGKVVYAVMELLEGETLRHRLATAAISWRESLEIAVPMAEGLAAAHSRDIVHRDLKPENVFLTSDGRVKILDFGLARHEAPSSSADPSVSPTLTQHTQPGTVMGTVGYMSPEQVLGEATDQRADIFSYGAILYEMFVGKRAFQGVSAAETLALILRDSPPALHGRDPRVPQTLLPILARCLEKRRENRFDSIRDVAFFLSSYSPLGEEGTPKDSGAAQPAAELDHGRVTKLRSEVSPRFSRLTFRRGTILAARFGPDGQTIYYGAAWDGQPFRSFSTRGEGSESSVLPIPDAGLLSISSAGEMAVLLDIRAGSPTRFSGTLGRVSVVGGTPRELAEGVKWADWSPDGKELAIVRRVGSRERLEFPIGNVLHETRGWITGPRVAPAGDRVAFIDHDLDGYVKSAFWIIDRTGERKSISSGWAGAYSLVWSPSGEEIWFTATKSSEAAALHAVSLSGAQRLLYRAPETLRVLDVSRDGRALLATDSAGVGILAKLRGEKQERNLSWLSSSSVCDLSEDGSLLLFNERPEYAAGSKPGVYLRRTDGSPAVRLGEGVALGFSPDRKWVLSISQSGAATIVLLPVGAGEARILALEGVMPESAAWFPDGRRLLVQARAPGQDVRLYAQDLQGGSPTAISPEGVRLAGKAAVSPDGRFAIGRSANGAVSTFDLETGRGEAIQGLVQGERFVCWTADGAGLYVFRIGEVPCSVFRLDPTTGHRELWKKLVPPDPAGMLSLQTLCITPDGKSYAYSCWSDYSDLYLVEGLK